MELVDGWTGPLDFQLRSDGSAQDLSGMTVELVMVGSGGNPISTSGDISFLDAALGKVRFSPDTGDLTSAASPLKSRFRVTDGAGKIVYYPSGRSMNWLIRPVT